MCKQFQNQKTFTALAVGALLALTASVGLAQSQSPWQAHAQGAGDARRADAAPALGLAEALALALAANPELNAAQREVEAAQALVLQAQARPNPDLAVSLEDQRRSTRTHAVQINLPIEWGGKRAARIAQAQGALGVAKEEWAARRIDVRAAVVAAFVDVAAAQARVALAQDSTDLAARATDAVAKRVAAGKVSPVEETKARIAQAAVRIEWMQAQGEERSARLRLAGLLGPNRPVFDRVAGGVDDLPVAPTVEDIRQRLSAAPAVRQAQLEIERRRALVEVERSKQAPDLTVSLGVKRPNELQRNQVILGVSAPLPLFDRNQGNVLAALKQHDKAQDEFDALNLRLATQLLQARERLVLARAEVDALQREVLPGAKSALDAATQGFEHGKFNFLEVLDAQRSYLAARLQYLRALAEAHRAAADIERVIGAPDAAVTSPPTKESA